MLSVNYFVESIRRNGNKDDKPNSRGNSVYRRFNHTDRYVVDFANNFHAEGWIQFDTDQDAHYFGVWVNPHSRTTLTYAEGDWTVCDCPTMASHNAEIHNACEFYGVKDILPSWYAWIPKLCPDACLKLCPT